MFLASSFSLPLDLRDDFLFLLLHLSFFNGDLAFRFSPSLSLERITLERLPRTKDQTLGLVVEKKKRFLGSRPAVYIKIIEREQIPSGCHSSLLRISISFLSSAKSADTTRFHYKRSLQDFLFDFPSIFAIRWKICNYKSSKSKIDN